MHKPIRDYHEPRRNKMREPGCGLVKPVVRPPLKTHDHGFL
jgi:hypothetical protein